MFKLAVFIVGLMAGAGGMASWLLSRPGGPASIAPTDRKSLHAHVELFKSRFRDAAAQGQRAERLTEEQLRKKFDAYRKGTSDPGTA